MTHRVYSSGTRISLLGYGAAEIIALSGGALRADETVPTILNRDRSDSCPMEKTVKGEENLEKMVRKIRAALEDLSSKKEEVVR